MNMMKAILLAILLISGWSLHSQPGRNYETNPDRKRANNWLFGDSIWLDFNSNPLKVRSGSLLYGLESAAAISDSSGNLLLYSDGVSVWNSNHNLLVNGTGLNGDPSSSQGVLFAQHPLYDSIIYLFYTDAQGGTNGFQMSVISINKNIDSCKLLEKNKSITSQVCESIASVHHQNGKFTWITVHSKTSNAFLAYIINDSGLVSCPVISNEGYIYDGNIFNCQTTSKFSSDGRYFTINLLNDLKVQLLSFDNLTGNFRLLKQFTNLAVPTGLQFSNNNTMLYVVERSKQINQYTIGNWQNNIATQINNKFFIVQIEKAPNKMILVNVIDSLYLGALENPDFLGSSANFNLRKVYLNGRISKYGLCNFNQSYFHTPSIDFAYDLDCIGNSANFQGRDTFYADIHGWTIGKPGKPVEASYGAKNITHIFKDTGGYRITYTASKSGRSDTIIKTISIFPKVRRDFLGGDTAYETGTSFSRTFAAPSGAHCYFWHNDSSASPSFTTDTTGTFVCKVTTRSFCTVTDTVKISSCMNDLSVPAITRSRDTLYVSSGDADSFVWLRNGTPYKSGKESFLALTDTGTYAVEAAKPGHCNRSSLTHHVQKLGVPDHLIQTGIRVFPNPADNRLFLEFKNADTYAISIYDATGKEVYSTRTDHDTDINLEGVPDGVYLLRITNTKNQQFDTKILKE